LNTGLQALLPQPCTSKWMSGSVFSIQPLSLQRGSMHRVKHSGIWCLTTFYYLTRNHTRSLSQPVNPHDMHVSAGN